MAGWPVVASALGASVAYAVAANLKHVSAGQVPDAQSLGGRSVARFVRATVTHRLWWASIVLDVVGVALQVLALRRGALSVVQPLLVSGLVLAVVFRARSAGRVRLQEIAWAAVLAAALGGFLVAAGVSAHRATEVGVVPATTVGVLGAVVAAACVVAARVRRGRAGSAALLGVAVGLVDASTAAMLKTLTGVASHGVVAVLGSWQLYVLLVCGAAAMLLNQLAFQAGPISASLPAISSVDPLASVVVGVLVFGETFRHGPGVVAVMVLLFGALLAAVVALTRVPVDRVAGVPA